MDYSITLSSNIINDEIIYNTNSKNPEIIEILCEYNQNLDWLSDSVKKIFIGGVFNQPLNNLPTSLLYLEITNQSFSQSLDFLPSSLKVLKISSPHIQQLDNLPNKLKVLFFTTNTFFQISNIPNGLKFFKSPNKYNYPIDDLPDSIEKLCLNLDESVIVNKWPVSLKILSVTEYSKQLVNLPNIIELYIDYNIPTDNLPDSIQILGFGSNYFHKINKLPQSIKFIWLACPQQLHILDNFNLESSQFNIIYESPKIFDDFDVNINYNIDSL